ncbi:hypothetical protein GCWU000182_01588 [Abiotrophia defectiva ATCC 49176]|uniref:Uncharacterized protein n=1 Tax=Abiotrophia defectiva ATCC 49176 TaxID=592010 RepID=W1Q1X0_ABIDE|nr:hypothetical protein GCWU000182_01588 [Abiotrophia defectiva ATCC 49176]
MLAHLRPILSHHFLLRYYYYKAKPPLWQGLTLICLASGQVGF